VGEVFGAKKVRQVSKVRARLLQRHKKEKKMGSGGWDSSKWQSFAHAECAGQERRTQVFSNKLNEAYDPSKFTKGIRESVDSPDNPLSTPVAIFTDCTGSMGMLAHAVVKKLDVVCEELLARGPVTDVHLMTGVVGDAYSDKRRFRRRSSRPTSASPNRPRNSILEGNGGGNGGESYALPWLSMAMQTATDSFDKRQKKGYLFTVGDEPIHGVEGSEAGKAVTASPRSRRNASSVSPSSATSRPTNVWHWPDPLACVPHRRRRAVTATATASSRLGAS
jgi:hypothetical protein